MVYTEMCSENVRRSRRVCTASAQNAFKSIYASAKKSVPNAVLRCVCMRVGACVCACAWVCEMQATTCSGIHSIVSSGSSGWNTFEAGGMHSKVSMSWPKRTHPKKLDVVACIQWNTFKNIQWNAFKNIQWNSVEWNAFNCI